MKEFVYGTDKQYEMLEQSLEDKMCHVYDDCDMPDGCSTAKARIGFEKEENMYALHIDKGIRCGKAGLPESFSDWLNSGTVRFLVFDDLKEFLTSLKCLY